MSEAHFGPNWKLGKNFLFLGLLGTFYAKKSHKKSVRASPTYLHSGSGKPLSK